MVWYQVLLGYWLIDLNFVYWWYSATLLIPMVNVLTSPEGINEISNKQLHNSWRKNCYFSYLQCCFFENHFVEGNFFMSNYPIFSFYQWSTVISSVIVMCPFKQLVSKPEFYFNNDLMLWATHRHITIEILYKWVLI